LVEKKMDISSLFAQVGDYDHLASVGWNSIEVFASTAPFFVSTYKCNWAT